jgi:translation elongation factor EF-Ts
MQPHALSAEHMDSLPLKDGRKTGEHLAEISQALGENVAITDVAYRFQPQEPNIFLGTYVHGKSE